MEEEEKENKNAPYAGLTPDAVLDAIEAAGWRPDGSQLALNRDRKSVV